MRLGFAFIMCFVEDFVVFVDISHYLLFKIKNEAKKLKEDADKKYNDELERRKTEKESV